MLIDSMIERLEKFICISHWSVRSRRIFLLTLPISAALYFVTFGIAIIALFLFSVVFYALAWIGDIWGEDEYTFPEIADHMMRATQPPDDKPDAPEVGQRWLHPVTGAEYIWSGQLWQATGNYPLSPNPLDF